MNNNDESIGKRPVVEEGNSADGQQHDEQPGTGQCIQVRSDGSHCRANTRLGSDFCFFHDPESAAERHAAQVSGGRERSRRIAVLPPDTPSRPLSNTREVRELLAETINQVRRGELDPHVSNAIGYLAGILLKAGEKDEMEQRLARLESIFADQQRTHTPCDFEFVNPPSRS